MKIGVLSDTHDRLTTLRRAIAFFRQQKVDAILHPGDIVSPFAARLMAPEVLSVPLYCCYGNNDGERAGLKKILPNLVDGPVTIKLGGKTILMHHALEWLTPQDLGPADIIVTGHTHKVINELRDGKLYLNPGECCGWVTDQCTIALLDPGAMKADIIQVHE